MIKTKKHKFKGKEFENETTRISIESKILITLEGHFIYSPAFNTKNFSEWFSFSFFVFRFSAWASASYPANLYDEYGFTSQEIFIL